jgi:hypothetical protein
VLQAVLLTHPSRSSMTRYIWRGSCYRVAILSNQTFVRFVSVRMRYSRTFSRQVDLTTSSADDRRVRRSICWHSRLAARHSLSNQVTERRTRQVEVRDGAIESAMFVTSVVYNSHISSTPTAGSVNTDEQLPEITYRHSRLVKSLVSIERHGLPVVVL